MLILGLTGGVALGKSTAAGGFRALGVPVFDADAAVHRLMAPGGGAVRPIAAAFPGCADPERGVDRAALGKRVFGDAAALRRLEAIVHPRVFGAERAWLAAAARRGVALVVLDVPLLFETGGQRRTDHVAAVDAPDFVQAARFLRRPGATEERLASIRVRQTPRREKRRRADVVIPTGLGRQATFRAIEATVGALRGRRGRAWPDGWKEGPVGTTVDAAPRGEGRR